MRPVVVGIPLILLYCAFLLTCESGGLNADQSKIHEIERMWDAMPIYPGLVEVSTSRSSTRDKAHISKSFKVAAPYDDVSRFYLEKLALQGWQLVDEKSMPDWGRDLGGRALRFTKGDYKLTIEYAGENGNKGWDYGIGIYWRDL